MVCAQIEHVRLDRFRYIVKHACTGPRIERTVRKEDVDADFGPVFPP